MGRNLHKQAQHPLHLIAATVKSFFDATGGITEGSPSGAKAVDWRLFDSMNPVVTTVEFDRGPSVVVSRTSDLTTAPCADPSKQTLMSC